MKTMNKKFRVVFKNGHIANVKGPYFERAMVLGGYGSCGSMEVDYYEECTTGTDDDRSKPIMRRTKIMNTCKSCKNWIDAIAECVIQLKAIVNGFDAPASVDEALGMESNAENLCELWEDGLQEEEDVMNEKTIKLSEMQVGDFGIIGGDNTVAQLKDNGKQGGCDTDLWLAYVGDVGDDNAAQQYGWDADDLCTIIEDTDQISGMPQ